jgi:glycosyltransferase involved in cell wall biosynthesis
MDDWPNTLYTQNELLGIARIYFEKRLNKLFNRSNGGLCISELMSIEYQKRYNLPFSSFVNCVDDRLFFAPDDKVVNKKFTLVYMGGLHLNRWKCLLDISEVVEKINKNGSEVIFKIFCPGQDNQLYSSYFQQYKNTKFEESVKLEEVSDILKTASLLVHIESFDENIAQYTRFSLSTKIPQYMASGKPILGYGPNNLASMQHILKAEAGQIVIEKGVDKLLAAISKLMHDHLKLNLYAKNGYEFSSKFHKKSKNIDRLRWVLNSYKFVK